MRILVIGKFYTEGFALHIAETLGNMGHDVHTFDANHKEGSPTFASSRFGAPMRVMRRYQQVSRTLVEATDKIDWIRSFRTSRLWSAVDGQRLDLVIVCHDFLLPNEVEDLKRRTGAPVALWFPDGIGQIVQHSRFMNAPYDALFFKDPFMVERLGGVMQGPVFYLPECFNPDRHTAADGHDQTYTCDLTTAGSLHSWRIALLKQLSDYNVELWGYPPPAWLPLGSVAEMYKGRGVFYQDKASAFIRARIVLTTLHPAEIWGVNVRCFEAAGIGAFQIVEWRPALQQLFEDGKELVSYSSMSDLREKIDYWLPGDDERRGIGQAARVRAYAEHTYRHRLEVLIETVGGRACVFPMPEVRMTYIPKKSRSA